MTPMMIRRNLVRGGVTLLEVIVSMGVLVVGLMGMASLIPLGRLEMSEGDRLDNSSTLGRAAFRELSVHGYLNPQMWVHPLNGAKVADMKGYNFSGAMVPPFAPLVIDPLMCAPRFQQEDLNASGPNGQETDHRTVCQYFPYGASMSDKAKSGWPEIDMPKFARATLRSYPIDGSRALAKGLAHTMRFDFASRFFRSSDDLVVPLPTDRVRRPVQVFAQSGLLEGSNSKVTAHDGVVTEPTLDQVAYRQFRGEYSWFFIVEPNPGERWSADDDDMPFTAGTTGSPYATNMFRVQVVVCNKRDLRDTSKMDISQDRVIGERCVWLDFLDRYTARMRVLDVEDEGTALKILDVKPNQWIAAASYFENPLLPGGRQCALEWFRVVNAADRPARIPDTNTWYREVTLAGRDMSSEGTSSLGLKLIPAQNSSPYSDVQPSHIAWGVVIPGVRGVYEKSIYLDRPSLWSPQ